MALSDDLKLDIAKTKFKEKLDSIETWDDFTTFLSGITKAKIKTFLKTNIQAEADKLNTQATESTDTATELETFKTDIDAI